MAPRLRSTWSIGRGIGLVANRRLSGSAGAMSIMWLDWSGPDCPGGASQAVTVPMITRRGIEGTAHAVLQRHLVFVGVQACRTQYVGGAPFRCLEAQGKSR